MKMPNLSAGHFYLLVEAAGICHPRQPMRLHAHCRSWARSYAARIPHLPRIRTGRGFNSQVSVTIKKPTKKW